MTPARMRKLAPGFLHVNSKDHLPPKNRLRAQVVTNSKGYLELNLNGRDLRAVPAEIFQFTATQVLRLAHNHIDKLPLMVAYLRTLKVLDLQHNLLASLPETLVNCRHLAELYLTANRLAQLPRSIGGLKHLRVLTLGENQFEQIPQEVGLMTSLRILDIHSNKLWHLPFSLQELKHLTQLNASDNMFDHVPLVLTKITSLQKLNLAKNRLASLPVDFDALRGLHELNLSHNCFVSISSLVASLKHLKYLSLANNRLKFLPPQMSQLQRLRVLHIQHNSLRHAPSLLRGLQFYNVSSNQLASFSVEGMRNLVSLSASCNNLDTVPRGLYKLKRLKFLYLDNNQLVELHEDLRHLKELRVLDVSNNQLVSLPRCLHKLGRLQSFNVKGNHKLRPTAAEIGQPKDGTQDSTSLKNQISRTKEAVMGQEHITDEHKDSSNISGNRSNILVYDVNESNVLQEKNASNSKNRQSAKASFNKGSQHTLLQMSQIPSDLQMYTKPRHGHTKGSQDFRDTGVSLPSGGVDSKLYQERVHARSALTVPAEIKAPKKPSSLQYLRHLLFGESKKTKSIRSDVGGSIPASNKVSEKSIHFQDRVMNSRGRDTANFAATRYSTVSRNSSSLWSHRKPPWKKSYGPYEISNEPLLANRIHFNIPDERRDEVDAKSDSHGYGTWRSRRHAPDGYFDAESLDYSDSSSYCGQGRTQRSPNVRYSGVKTQGSGDAIHGPHTDFYCSDDLSHEEDELRNNEHQYHRTKNTRHHYNNNDTHSEGCFRNKYINSACHCCRSNNMHTIRLEGSGKRRNSLDINSSSSRFITTQDRSSFVSETNVKGAGKHGHQHRHGQPGFISQSYTALHKSFPESPLVNSSKRMTIPLVGCWFRDGRVSSPRFINEYTDQPRHQSHPHVHHGDVREPSEVYHSDPTSDADQSNSFQSNQDNVSRNAPVQRRDMNTVDLRGSARLGSQSDHGASLRKNFSEFDHVLMTTNFTGSELKQNETSIHRNGTTKRRLHGSGHQESSDDMFNKGTKLNPGLSHSRSVDSLIDLTSTGTSFRKTASSHSYVPGGVTPDVLARGFSELSLAHSDGAQTMGPRNQSGTDYNLLGVCSQVETLLNKNLLQPVIGYHHRGRHSFAEKTIRENAQGLWRMDDTADANTNKVNGDNVKSDNSDEGDLPGLEYTQPQTFTVTSEGGQFVSSAGPRVEISIPALATDRPLHITIQLMFVPPSVISKVKELNYFVNNIVAMGPVVYFHSATEAKLNSPATITIPTPADVKGGHLTVLTVRKDNSCIPCTSGYRAGKLRATFTSWQFAGKVALITQAKCKYKACKSMEQLLQCVGAGQI